jgi:phosphoribosylamine--glycine ligase
VKVLVIGGGGKEHAIVWKLSRSRHISKVYCCPGNPGIAGIAELIDIRPDDFNALIDFAKYDWVDFTIVGSGHVFSKDIVSLFEREGCRIFGAGRTAAKAESSRVFAKNLMRLHRIPTAEYKVFNSYLQAEDYVRMKGAPIVIKTDGFADTSIFRVQTVEEATEILKKIMTKRMFGDAGNQVVIEEDLKGEKFTFVALTDGKTVRPLTSLVVCRNLYDNDKGPATIGMGAYSPAPVVTRELGESIIDEIISPLAKALSSDGLPYKGLLSADIVVKKGLATVLGFHGNFSDPDTQAVLPRLKTDFVDMALAIMEERLSDVVIEWEHESSVCIVMASKGYPGKYAKGATINGLERVKQLKDVVVFHEDTTFQNSSVVSAGGRVISIAAAGTGIEAAREQAYNAAEMVHFDGMRFRTDIGILSKETL